jgi:hypothetical protein
VPKRYGYAFRYNAAIQRIAFSGESAYRYTISSNSIKNAAGLLRLKNSVVQGYVNYFRMVGVTAIYNDGVRHTEYHTGSQ